MSFRADTDRPPSHWCERHLASCPACRRAGRVNVQLARHLERTAMGLRRPVPPFLASRILTAVRATPAPASQALRIAWTRVAWTLGAAMLVLLAGVASWPWKPGDLRPANATTQVARNALDLATNLPFRLPDGARLLAYGAKLDEPLEREWQRVVADAQSAARSLAAAFVPETALEF